MDLKEWLSLQSPKVRNNATIVEHARAYHISTDPKIKRFTPMIGNRMAKTEDRTVPRVCCNSNLVGCISGHAATIDTSFDHWWANKTQVFYIYEMPFSEYIKPNAKLVYDAEDTGELWIVPNAANTTAFKANIVGQFTMIGFIANARNGHEKQTVEYIGFTDGPVALTDRVTLDGFFKIVLDIEYSYNNIKYNNVLSLKKHTRITRAEYDKELAELASNVERTKGQ